MRWLRMLGLLVFLLQVVLVACQQGGQQGGQQGQPDFSVVLSKASLVLSSANPSAEVLVQIVAKNGFTDPVALRVEGLPEGARATFNPVSVAPQSTGVVTGIGAATLRLERGSSNPGTYNLRIVGESGSKTKEARISLEITLSLEPNVLFDFSSGIPQDWRVIDNTGNGGWTVEDDCDRESDYGPLDPIQSPFAIIDSDCLGSVDVDTELRTPVLNLSGFDTVKLRFDHFFYFFEEEIGDVDVSTDGGATWVNVARFQGEDYGPETVVLDISQIAANQPNVLIRFHYYDANYEWFWIVDNIIVEAE